MMAISPRLVRVRVRRAAQLVITIDDRKRLLDALEQTQRHATTKVMLWTGVRMAFNAARLLRCRSDHRLRTVAISSSKSGSWRASSVTQR